MADGITAKDLENLVPPLLAQCRLAGDLIEAHYHHRLAPEYETKQDDSPLTRADLASHAQLEAGLHALDASIPILSEESSPAAIAGRRGWRRFWLVDPLDGTREFLDRTGEFTVNIALIDGHLPVLGVLYLPLRRRAYVGIPGVCARRYDAAGAGDWSVTTLAVRPLRQDRELVVLGSRRHGGGRFGQCLAWLEAHWGPLARLEVGGALKFCQLAEGEGDFYPRFSPCCEWDTAAGQALLEAAGGRVVGLDGEPLRYNLGDSLYSPPFYALADAAHPLWRELLRARPG